jgi:hypothetical protein
VLDMIPQICETASDGLWRARAGYSTVSQ